MITVHCDHCKTQITEVVYRVQTVPAERVDGDPGFSTSHLHWGCLPLWGRSTRHELDTVRTSIDAALVKAPEYEEPPF